MTHSNNIRRISIFNKAHYCRQLDFHTQDPLISASISPLHSPWRERIHVILRAISATSRPLKVLDEAMPMPQLSRNRKESEGAASMLSARDICLTYIQPLIPTSMTVTSPSPQRSTRSRCVPAMRSLPLLPSSGEAGICPDIRPAWGQG